MSIFGETLRQARAHKGVTVKEAEQATRISRLYLSALEDEHFEALPPLIYQRGIVRNYATYLDLDPNKLLAMFEDARGGVIEAEVGPSAPPLNMPSHWAPNFAIIAFIFVLGMIVFAWFYSAFLAPGDVAPTATAPVETVTPMPTEEEARRFIDSLVPTPTATATVEQSPTPEEEASATAEPSPTPENVVVAEDDADDSADAAERLEADDPAVEVEEAVVEEPVVVEEPIVEEEPEPTGPTVTVVFSPTVDIILTVIDADGVVRYDGWLAAGASTEAFTSASFQVYTSDLNDTWITNLDTGQTFYMSEADGEGTFQLAPL